MQSRASVIGSSKSDDSVGVRGVGVGVRGVGAVLRVVAVLLHIVFLHFALSIRSAS